MEILQEVASDVDGHFVQELGLDMEPGGEVWHGEALIPAAACAPGTRVPLASVLVTYADMIAGAHVRTHTLPRLSVTVDLTVDLVASDLGQRAVESLTLRSRIVRAGKRMFVTETTFELPDGDTFAVCSGTFSSISRTLNALADATGPAVSRFERELLSEPLTERAGITVPTPGRAEVARRADLGNSTDSLMGGVTAMVGEAAALSLVGAGPGRPHVVDRLQIRYLAPVRVGPARAEVRLHAGQRPRHLLLVDVGDAARPGEPAAELTVSCGPAPSQVPA